MASEGNNGGLFAVIGLQGSEGVEFRPELLPAPALRPLRANPFCANSAGDTARDPTDPDYFSNEEGRVREEGFCCRRTQRS